MATAKVPLAMTIWEININTSGQSDSPGITISPSDKIEFHNLAPFPVSIQFICANGPVFTNIASVGTNQISAQQSPQKDVITTDYNITNLNTNQVTDLCSIEVSDNPPNLAAPLLIPITAGNPTIATLSIPQRGWVQFDLGTGQYNLSWNPSNAFPAPQNPIGPNNSPAYQAQTGNQNGSATYTLTSVGGVVGSGTVKIRS